MGCGSHSKVLRQNILRPLSYAFTHLMSPSESNESKIGYKIAVFNFNEPNIRYHYNIRNNEQKITFHFFNLPVDIKQESTD